MDDSRVGRRRLLATTGAGFVAAVAGCTTPQSPGPIAGNSSSGLDVDSDELADGSAFTEVYEAVIDSVTKVHAFGVDDPITGEAGRGQGSGFLVDAEYVVTNEHVVSGASEVDLQYINGDWTTTTVAGTDFYSDLAVLRVDHAPEAAEPLALADTQPVPGQQVLAVGNPLGLEGSMSSGIVSGVNRSINPPGREFSFPNVVQTDAGLNPGNSGGPLVSLDGTVVGVVNAGGGENIGFAISAALASRVVPALIEDGEYHHSYLGVSTLPVDRFIAEENRLREATGVIVVQVDSASGAAGALRESDDFVSRNGQPVPVGGDVIVAIDGEPTPDGHAFTRHLALETSPGDDIALSVLRDGDETEVEVTLGTRPQSPR